MNIEEYITSKRDKNAKGPLDIKLNEHRISQSRALFPKRSFAGKWILPRQSYYVFKYLEFCRSQYSRTIYIKWYNVKMTKDEYLVEKLRYG